MQKSTGQKFTGFLDYTNWQRDDITLWLQVEYITLYLISDGLGRAKNQFETV